MKQRYEDIKDMTIEQVCKQSKKRYNLPCMECPIGSTCDNLFYKVNKNKKIKDVPSNWLGELR